jgi:uncharacterized damage-inducible protein DinB
VAAQREAFLATDPWELFPRSWNSTREVNVATERKLSTPVGYDFAANPRIASFAAQLDDQLALLKRNTAELETRHLEWQPHAGVNTVGMLLAHLAVVDMWWIRIAPHRLEQPDAEAVMKEALGISMDDDGLPLAAEGRHPAALAGKSLGDYLQMIDAAREVTHRELRQWRDADLAGTFSLRERNISREWTLYHVLEHFAGHHGQILLLKHFMRDAGLLPRPESK